MDKPTDLRVIKTKRAIKQAFLDIIRTKELNKITITELAKLAEINKGTFYLHYPDIYALYGETLAESIRKTAHTNSYYAKMITEPDVFVRGFFTPTPESATHDESVLFLPENLRYCESFLSLMIQAIMDNIYATGILVPTSQTQMKLQFLIGGMFMYLIHGVPISRTNELLIDHETIEYLVKQIKYSFPDQF